MLDGTRIIAVRALAIACLALPGVWLGACGGGSATAGRQSTPGQDTSAASSTPASAQAPRPTVGGIVLPGDPSAGQVVATVGPVKITAAQLAHVMKVKNPKLPVPTPPDYAACIASLKASPSNDNVGLPTSASGLKVVCQTRYQGQLAAALSRAIHDRWLLGQAAEQGLSVSRAEIEHELQESKQALGGSNAKLEAYLKNAGQTLGELEFESKLNHLTNKIFQGIASQGVSGAQAARFYAEHKQQFTIPQGRDLGILRTATEASALKAKQELQSGKSFSSVAKELSGIGQPLGARNGAVSDLKPGIYQEPALNNAIFSAKPGRLYGPIQITAPHKTIAPETGSGFFLFEVRRIVPERQIPLAKVKGAIAAQLAKQQKAQAVVAYTKAFKGKWRARTDCRPGYVLVPLCKQFKLTKAIEAQEDPYSL